MKKSLQTHYANNFHPNKSNSKTSFKSFKLHTESSTRSTNSSHKTSVRKLLEERASLNEKKQQFTLNLTYKDIEVKKEEQIRDQIQNFLCYKGIITKQRTCRCFSGKKCEWVAKWLSVIIESRVMKYPDLSEKLLKQIDIDLQRTSNNSCPNLPQLQFKQLLKKTLISYCSSDYQINYIQGFNYLAASIVVHAKNFADSFRIFNYLMKQKRLREIYLDDFQLAKKHARKISETLKIKSYVLFIHLFKLGVNLDMFILGWLLPLFSNIVSQIYMHLVIENFLLKGWMFIYSFCLTILIYFRQEILQMNCQQDIFLTLSVQSILARQVSWDEIIQSSLNFPISKKDIFMNYSQTSTVIN